MALTEIARLLPWLVLHRLTRYPLSLISTLQKGHLYFAKQGTFLFCIDINFFTLAWCIHHTRYTPLFRPYSIKIGLYLINKVWNPAQNGEITAVRMAHLP